MESTEIRTVISLLASTDMTFAEIAERMGCSRSAICALNRKFRVREYQGRRSNWIVPSPAVRDRGRS